MCVYSSSPYALSIRGMMNLYQARFCSSLMGAIQEGGGVVSRGSSRVWLGGTRKAYMVTYMLPLGSAPHLRRGSKEQFGSAPPQGDLRPPQIVYFRSSRADLKEGRT